MCRAGKETPVGRTASYLVRAAASAPSVHNTQPWRFVSRGEEVGLYADTTRQLAITDPDGPQMPISCGAAVCTMRIAMRHLGFRPVTRILPEPGGRDLLAVVGWGPYAGPTE